MRNPDSSDNHSSDELPVGLSSTQPHLWKWLAYGSGLLVALGVGYMVSGVPLQLFDGVDNILGLQARTDGYLETFWELVGRPPFTRPLMVLQAQLLFDLSGGHYFLTFKLFHVIQIVAVVLLFVRALRVRSAAQLALSILAVSILIGLHTFEGTVREAFPVNNYLSEVLYMLIVLNLADSRHRWWKDALAIAVFFVAVYTIESGILVWVTIAAAYMFGLRGLSRAALGGSSLLLMLYMYLRFIYFDIGTPQLLERPSGFGFGLLEAAELQARFGDAPLPFYLYNVVSNFLSVLLSEPRAGVWTLIGSWTTDTVRPWMIINVAASLLALVLLVRFTVGRAPRWLRWSFDRQDALFLVALGVLGANACLSFSFAKNPIMSVGGAIYAIAVYVAADDYLQRLARSQPTRRWIVASTVFFLALGTTWATRSLALQKILLEQVPNVHREWGFRPDHLERQRARYPTAEAAALLDEQLREAMYTEARAGLAARRFLDPYLSPH